MKIFNIIAELCSFIINSCPEEFFVRYSCISIEEKRRINEIVRSELAMLFERDSSDAGACSVAQIEVENLDGAFFSSLDSLILRLKDSADYFSIVGLVQILDESLESLLRKQIAEFQQDDFSVVLNTNRESTGIGLLPRCSCVWERKRRLSHCYNRMDNFLFNLLLMENSILGELIDKHFFLKASLFPHFSERNSLKIAATPLRRERKFDVLPYSEDKVQYFKIAYDGSDFSVDNELIWSKILLLDIMDKMTVTSVQFCLDDLMALLTFAHVKAEKSQVRKILKDYWKLSPAPNALTYTTYINDYSTGIGYNSKTKVGRFFSVTRDTIRHLCP